MVKSVLMYESNLIEEFILLEMSDKTEAVSLRAFSIPL